MYVSGIYNIISFMSQNKAVILMYHSINQPDCPYVYPDSIISIESFEKQIEYLTSKKRIVRLPELVKHINDGVKLPRGAVAITFDDGYYDFFSNAYPILRKYNCSCTLFPITGLLYSGELKWEDQLAYLVNSSNLGTLVVDVKGRSMRFKISNKSGKLGAIRQLNSMLTQVDSEEIARTISLIEKESGSSVRLPERVTLRYDEVVSLKDEPLISFGAHTHNHVSLGRVSLDTAESEIIRSKKEVERATGKECNIFSYPIGKARDFNETAKEILKENGFQCAVTTIPGKVDVRSDPFELRRIAVTDDASYRFKCTIVGFALQRS